MEKTICGTLKFNNKKYYFNFQDNILTFQPRKMLPYAEWFWIYIEPEKEYMQINLEGETNEGKYIAFLNVRPVQIGRGAYSTYVPAYISGESNNIIPIIKCDKIKTITLKGDCIDRLYYSKQIISKKHNENRDTIVKVDHEKFNNKKIKIENEIHNYYVLYKEHGASDLNTVLSVKSVLEINFEKDKKLTDILSCYLKVEKFFSFLNNRKIICFDEIKLWKQVNLDGKLNYVSFELIVNHNPKEKLDLYNNKHSYIQFENIEKNYVKLYSEITKDRFITSYYPTNKNESNLVNDIKYISLASAFESEFNELFPKHKSLTNENFSKVKNQLLAYVECQISDCTNKKILKYWKEFKKMIEKTEGSLHEKILFSLKKFDKNIRNYKNFLLKEYKIKTINDGELAKSFVDRRNKISHGELTQGFTDQEMISYLIIKILVYCITLQRCGFNEEEINIFLRQLFFI